MKRSRGLWISVIFVAILVLGSAFSFAFGVFKPVLGLDLEGGLAVILADKSDVHRSRVRKAVNVDRDIHDRVNYAVEQSFLRVDSDARTVSLELTIDTTISQVMEYFEIFLGRMQMCRLAAEAVDARFRLVINGQELLA